MLELVLTGAIAFYVAWNLGANDVANSMGTSVGSGALRLVQALAIAGVLEFSGAVLFGRRVAATLSGDILDPTNFAQTPQVFVWGMLATLIACGLWLQIATTFGLPVASSHAVVGAIAGFGWVAVGTDAVRWKAIGLISLAWVLTPLLSGAIAALLYSLLRYWILQQPNPLAQLMEWLPWLSAILVSTFGWLLLPILVRVPLLQQISLPPQTLVLGMGAIATVALTLWNQPARPPTSPESLFARFQILSACGVAFAHGANDVGNAIAPLAAIYTIQQTGGLPMAGVTVPLWILALGGAGIVAGLGVAGKTVIQTIGQGIIPLVPSMGFCAELATAVTILLATRLGLPVSTSHALVGAVAGIGLVQQLYQESHTPLQVGTLQQIALAWLMTIPVCAVLSAAVFSAIRYASLVHP